MTKVVEYQPKPECSQLSKLLKKTVSSTGCLNKWRFEDIHCIGYYYNMIIFNNFVAVTALLTRSSK